MAEALKQGQIPTTAVPGEGGPLGLQVPNHGHSILSSATCFSENCALPSGSVSVSSS